MSTSYPLPTVAPTLTENGISAPGYADILASFKASIQAIYGSDIYLDPDSQDGQMLAIFAQAQYDANSVAVAVYNSYNPQTAVGVALSSAVKVNGITRAVASNSTATVTLVGTAGTYIPAGVVGDVNGYLWDLDLGVTIPIGGSIDVNATCETPGAIAAAPHTITSLFTRVVGWQTATNALAAVAGAPVETDGELRLRQKQSTELNALTTAEALLARISNLTGVQRAKIYVNDSGTTDSNSIPAHSFSLVIQGGDATEIAQTIALTKGVGAGSYGTSAIVVPDANGDDMTIHFEPLVQVPIYVTVVIHKLAGFVDSSVSAISAALVAFVNGLGIGETVYHNWMLAVAATANTSYVVVSLVQGTAVGSQTTSDIAITYKQAATLTAANIAISADNP
jgi:uncharacterized phage protein gp47/JayE